MQNTLIGIGQNRIFNVQTKFNSTRAKTKRARKLRNETTDAEGYVWGRISRRQVDGFKFRRQHPVGPYILDFYCPELGLCIELDGEQHGSDEGLEHDLQRTQFLEAQGIEVIRFWNTDVYEDLDSVISTIYSETQALALRKRVEAEKQCSSP